MTSEPILRGLRGKRVLITGAAKGQGYSHALGFADAGCHVALLDVTHAIDGVYAVATEELLTAAAREVSQRDVAVVVAPCDVREESDVADAVQRVYEAFDGVIDVVVNNAGIAALDPIHEMRTPVMNAIIDTNLKGPIHVAKHTVGGMIARRSGSIINISSAVTGGSGAMLSHYVASKHAVNGLTIAWATELAEFGIRVNAVCPGTIQPGIGHGSGMVAGLAEAIGSNPEDAFEMFTERGGLPGAPWRLTDAEVTDAVLFLASDNAAMMTGVILPVDGGHMAR